jgi:uncharacterized DUF497 family protein
MVAPRFEWDPWKSRANEDKHGVSFEEARTVFYDDDARIISDTEHSDDEERFILLGRSAVMRLLVVCRCYRRGESAIRIISARMATARERRRYVDYLE